ncbi:hypothetical protein CYMTET_4381 [Cymbomonas tetramitiformis]|uniref:Uncharacterized protein n=1 Tax=Cymbomonas tetramitiformis TaxID=36881 RepID=A0AAE0H1G1_9CHLO|nr:hypothetical protein CYMTET_4381 [Cymbomonas tetramitiformis]
MSRSATSTAKLTQAVDMAYDMVVGHDVQLSAVHSGQQVMVLRMLPHLIGGLRLLDFSPEICNKSVKVLHCLAMSRDGCSEMLAHPNSSGSLIPSLLLILQPSRGNENQKEQVVINTLNALNIILDDPEGQRQVFDVTVETPGYSASVLIEGYVKMLTDSLASPRSSMVTTAVQTLSKIVLHPPFMEWLTSVEFETFLKLLLALIKRMRDPNTQISNMATFSLLGLCEDVTLQIRVMSWDDSLENELKALFLAFTLFLHMALRDESRRENAVYTAQILAAWTSLDGGVQALLKNDKNLPNLLSGMSAFGELLLEDPKTMKYLLVTITNLLKDRSFARWLAERPGSLEHVLALIASGFKFAEVDVVEANMVCLQRAFKYEDVQASTIQLGWALIDDLLSAIFNVFLAESTSATLRNSVQVLLYLTESEAWIQRTCEWVSRLMENSPAKGHDLIVRITGCMCAEDANIKQHAGDLLTTLTQIGGEDIFKNSSLCGTLTRGLQQVLVKAVNAEDAENVVAQITFILSWQERQEHVVQLLVGREDAVHCENLVHALVITLGGKNTSAIDCVAALLTLVARSDELLTSFSATPPAALAPLFSGLNASEFLQLEENRDLRSSVVQLLARFCEVEPMKVQLCLWWATAAEESKQQAIQNLADALQGDLGDPCVDKALQIVQALLTECGQSMFQTPAQVEDMLNSLTKIRLIAADSQRGVLALKLTNSMLGLKLFLRVDPLKAGEIYDSLVQLLVGESQQMRDLACQQINALTGVGLELQKNHLMEWVSQRPDHHVKVRE